MTDRVTKKLFDEICEGIFREFRLLPGDEGRELLLQVSNNLEREITAEQQFQHEFGRLRDELLRVDGPGELARLHGHLAGLVAASFRRRQSAPALHVLCSAVLDMTVTQALRLAVEGLAEEGLGSAPPYAWLVMGAAGRREATLPQELEGLLVHGPGAEEAAYCAAMAGRAISILGQCGIRSSKRGIMPDRPAWRASPEEWEERLEELCRRERGPGSRSARSGLRLGEFFPRRATNLSTPLFELADLRVVAGNHDLGDKLRLQVRAAAQRHPACILEAAQTVASLPSPFNFFGKYRVERSGPHRGMIELDRWGSLPLISMVRLQAVTVGIAETGTLERIRLLLKRGALDVALGKQLLLGGVEIFRLKAELDAREEVGNGGWLSPGELSPTDGKALREALESISTLQKVIHSSLAQQV